MKRAGWMSGPMLLGTALLCAVGAQAQTQTRLTIVALGASNTEGWGVAASEAYPRKLQALLNARNINATVINAGVAGDTTGGMLARLERAVPVGTHVVILQPGTNDETMGVGAQRALAYRETGAILGIAVYAQSSAMKMRHRANLFSMYVRPHARGRGAGSALVKAVLNVAKGKALQVHCNVVTSNDRARRLYERHGFSVYGTEPRALKVGDRFYDEHLMICRLD